MGRRKTRVLVPLIILLLLISLLASNFSCISSSYLGIGGDWNPSALNAAEVSRLSLPERSGEYDNFESTVISSQTELYDFMFSKDYMEAALSSSGPPDIESWNLNTWLLQYVDEWQIDFSTHNLILYRYTESSGSIGVTISKPHIEDDAITINVYRVLPGAGTDDMAYYCYAFKVSEQFTSVTFVVEGKDDVSFRFNEREEKEAIISGGPSLKTYIAGIECDITVSLWRDFRPRSLPGNPLNGVITIAANPVNTLPPSWIVDSQVTITHDSDKWETELTDIMHGSSVWGYGISEGPKWETGTTASVSFQLSVSYLTTLERVDKTYILVFNHVPIKAISFR